MVHRDDSLRTACKNFEQDLVLYYYGECVGAEQNRIESHLEDCSSCRHFLDDLRKLLPLTAKPDEPPQAFWESYTREIRKKLTAAEERASWGSALFTFFRPWPVPALATALVLVLALTLTLTKGRWYPNGGVPEEEAILEDLEFFKAMDFLESIDLLEAIEGKEIQNSETNNQAL